MSNAFVVSGVKPKSVAIHQLKQTPQMIWDNLPQKPVNKAVKNFTKTKSAVSPVTVVTGRSNQYFDFSAFFLFDLQLGRTYVQTNKRTDGQDL